ncbi:uncharacterized protein MYCGRDRAFT_109842 [Zymoseptoria tritici IPO323]|uniref:MIT domain-containing protein n=1 Tax=Zymoseptoria tritici (strain CBS 115943 / IPO323) TaxID=336722 RepID=F9XDA3_ZYMTI|nr:uncharacterized protein MYCGRDRAFT_109842 [Zymoseptoria tritici IPO323]EGP86457.1 hypothetical protein MYCGRDRAFT_109842 [Zymoseptoria tritici IPO323]
MQAVSAVQGPFDANSASQSLLQKHRQNTRSGSLSSGSVVTIKRPESLSRIRSASPAGDADLNTLRLRRPSSAGADTEQGTGEGMGMHSIDRWSHSTTSSAGSLANTRRQRSSSGAVLSSLAGQHYSSPQRKAPHPPGTQRTSTERSPQQIRNQLRTDHLPAASTALSPTPTTPALTDPNEPETPSTSNTVSTPSAYTNPPYDYFRGNEDAYGPAKAQRESLDRNQAVANTMVTSSQPAQAEYRQSSRNSVSGQRARSSAESSNRRSREKTEKDKKAMLSKALQKANTAVLLDNAQNYEGALEAYGDACDLLQQVMERTSGATDKQKLDAIRDTYSNRIVELRLLVDDQPTGYDEKNLPARPMSDNSPTSSPHLGPASPQYPGIDVVSPIVGDESAPRLPQAKDDRDSFFSRTMAAVENSASFDFSNGPTPMGDHTSGGAEDDRGILQSADSRPMYLPPPEFGDSVPPPLSPRRSPRIPDEYEDRWQREVEQSQEEEPPSERPRPSSRESMSWLDTIDESVSSCSDSVHSVNSQQGVRRKHIRGLSGATDPDFDAAFDAAVEAAYGEGFEPDMEARRRMTAYGGKARHESVQVPSSEIEEITPGALQTSRIPQMDDTDDEEEERILDEMTNEYGQGFNFDLQTKSALPRQSDSSGYSRSTWQSSQMSDRATAATSLSTVAEDRITNRMSTILSVAPPDTSMLPPCSAPPRGSLPRPPSAGASSRGSTVRNRRLSGANSKQLKIDTAPRADIRKRASTFHQGTSPFAEEHEHESASAAEDSFGGRVTSASSEPHHQKPLRTAPSLELKTKFDGSSMPTRQLNSYRQGLEPSSGDSQPTRQMLFRKNKSSASLREHAVLMASPDLDGGSSLATPMSSMYMTFAAKRSQTSMSQRATLPQIPADSQMSGGAYLFDTTLCASQAPVSPRSPHTSPQPVGLEPCPESFLLRPFWLMRAMSSTIVHPRGGFLSTKMFVPREVWQMKGVKLKMVEEKVANCDLLTAALGRLSGVDTNDADAVMDELQSFEEVMERVQAALTKKLGSDVGVHGVAGMFKDASAAAVSNAVGNSHGSDSAAASDKAAKSNSGKSYLSSWRKLRNKSSGAPMTSSSAGNSNSRSSNGKDQHTMPSVPMTTFVPVERRGNKRDARNLVFEGPNKEYMGSLARLFDGVQILDQIARQVEDPGLKHSSPTHVGLELSIRHAAEFFGFYICRFVLADLGLLMDKFVKRGTEWVLA